MGENIVKEEATRDTEDDVIGYIDLKTVRTDQMNCTDKLRSSCISKRSVVKAPEVVDVAEAADTFPENGPKNRLKNVISEADSRPPTTNKIGSKSIIKTPSKSLKLWSFESEIEKKVKMNKNNKNDKDMNTGEDVEIHGEELERKIGWNYSPAEKFQTRTPETNNGINVHEFRDFSYHLCSPERMVSRLDTNTDDTCYADAEKGDIPHDIDDFSHNLQDFNFRVPRALRESSLFTARLEPVSTCEDQRHLPSAGKIKNNLPDVTSQPDQQIIVDQGLRDSSEKFLPSSATNKAEQQISTRSEKQNANDVLFAQMASYSRNKKEKSSKTSTTLSKINSGSKGINKNKKRNRDNIKKESTLQVDPNQYTLKACWSNSRKEKEKNQKL